MKLLRRPQLRVGIATRRKKAYPETSDYVHFLPRTGVLSESAQATETAQPYTQGRRKMLRLLWSNKVKGNLAATVVSPIAIDYEDLTGERDLPVEERAC